MNDKITNTDGRLYYTDSHLHIFDGTVVEMVETKKGIAAVLDKTAFFPEGGGQSADTGLIGDVEVTDVRESDGRILHYVKTPLNVGEVYTCKINWEQRYRRMQNHSGEHIVSGISHTLFAVENVGFHMGAECMTVDFDKEISWDELMEVEKRANEAVRANLPVTASFPDSETLKALNYRSKLELTHDVRIVEIPGIDICACCAPHVSYTGEIGLIKILESTKHRGGVRVSIICGMDALDAVRVMQNNVTAVSHLLSAKRHECASAVERVLEEQARLRERIAEINMSIARSRAEEFDDVSGNICIRDDVLDDVSRRELVNMLAEKCTGFAAVFSGNDEKGYNYIIGSRTLDLRKLSKNINSGIGGKGGGTSEMIQGRATFTFDAISEFSSRFSAEQL